MYAPAIQTSVVSDGSMLPLQILGILQWFSSVLILAGVIGAIIFLVKSKKKLWKRILLALLFVVIPYVIYFIIARISFSFRYGI